MAVHEAWRFVDAGVLIAAAMAMSCGASAREASGVATKAVSSASTGTPWEQVGVMPILDPAPEAYRPGAEPAPAPPQAPPPAPPRRSPRVVPPGPPLLDHGGIDGFADLRTPGGWRPHERGQLFDGRRLARRLRRCVDHQLKSNPQASGKVLLHLRIDAKGRVTDVHSEHSAALAMMAACFRGVIAKERFRAPGEPATLTLPIHIMAP